jgi:putative acetyltransferase
MQQSKVEAGGLVVRSEQPADIDAIGQVHRAAFPTDVEARLVEQLRRHGRLWLSLVAEDASGIIGHIAFSPIRIEGTHELTPGVGLAPVAVRPEY